LPCIPYEHHPTAVVERDHRHLGDGVVTALDQPHLSDKFVAYAYYDTVEISNMMPSVLDPTTSPYNLWEGRRLI
jgi:hypothetical protein